MATKNKQASASTPAVTVRVQVDNHTHAGQPCAIGDQLDVDPLTAAWMQKQGVAEPVTAAETNTEE